MNVYIYLLNYVLLQIFELKNIYNIKEYFLINIYNFINIYNLLSGSKGPFWESNFLCVYILLLLWTFDSRKASFWLTRAVLGITISMCIHYPSTIPLEN
jgi:hypothetical protein